jgi:hypothetical protein
MLGHIDRKGLASPPSKGGLINFARVAGLKVRPHCMDANNNPSFYRQLGKEADQLIASALDC